MPDPTMLFLVIATFTALFISSTVGYGGSLVLVPALVLVLGPREGIALAALLLTWNNVFKVVAYRRNLPFRQGWPLLVVTALGVVLGTSLLISLPPTWVIGAVVATSVGALAVEVIHTRLAPPRRGRVGSARRRSAVPLMGVSAVVSGASGASGPLKGIAIRNLQLSRLDHVGLASLVSLTGDGLKASLFAQAGLLPDVAPLALVATLPMMPLAAWIGRRANTRMGERVFRYAFWTVVGGYTMRLAGVWF